MGSDIRRATGRCSKLRLVANSAPSFSVVIPAYRGAATIRRAVASALAQSYEPLEVVICDDGSPDDTARALGDLRDRVILIRQEHGGISSARNNAVRSSYGDWIVLLDQDDEWLPERLEATAAVIQEGPANLDVVTTDAIVRTPDGCDRAYTETAPFEFADQRSAILQRNFIYASAAVRRSAWERIGGFSEETDDEYDAWVRLILSGSLIATTGRPLAVYNMSKHQKSRDSQWMNSSAISTMRWAISQRTLTGGERKLAEARLARARRDLLVSRALAAIADRSPGARQLAFQASLHGILPARSRMKFVLAAVTPSVAARRIRRSARGEWYGPGASSTRNIA